MKKYTVRVCDWAGEFAFYHTDSFDEVLSKVEEFEREYPSKFVDVANWDRADYDTHGLTAEELEKIDEVRA